jgi:hypothetical protein
MKLSSGKPANNATRNDLGKSVQIPRHSQLLGPSPGPNVSGASVARVTVPQPAKTEGRPIPHPRGAAAPSQGSRISDAVRADLGKLSPELAAGIRSVADRK